MDKLNVDLTEHPLLFIASLAPILFYVVHRCKKMHLSPLLPLAGLIGGFLLELKRSGAGGGVGSLSGMVRALGTAMDAGTRTQQGTDRGPARR